MRNTFFQITYANNWLPWVASHYVHCVIPFAVEQFVVQAERDAYQGIT